MIIVTQTEEAVNLDSVAKINLASGVIEDETSQTENEVYVVLAYGVLPEVYDEDPEKFAIQLGAFSTEIECRSAYNKLLESIGKNEPIFYVPQSVEIESK